MATGRRRREGDWRTMVVAAGLTLLTLAGGAAALLAADFGARPAVHLLLWSWLLTAGLPATAAVAVTAWWWGRLPGLHGLGAFAAVAAAAAFAAELLAVQLLRRRS